VAREIPLDVPIADTARWRVIAFRAVLLLLAAGFAKAFVTAIWNAPEMAAAFRGLPASAAPWVAAAAVAGFGLVLGLWLWRRWAWYLLLAACAAGIAVDAWLGAPLAHRAASATLTVALLALAYPLRARFR
jgi:hypothetical protein